MINHPSSFSNCHNATPEHQTNVLQTKTYETVVRHLGRSHQAVEAPPRWRPQLKCLGRRLLWGHVRFHRWGDGWWHAQDTFVDTFVDTCHLVTALLLDIFHLSHGLGENGETRTAYSIKHSTYDWTKPVSCINRTLHTHSFSQVHIYIHTYRLNMAYSWVPLN